MSFDEMAEMDLPREERIAAEAKRLVRTSLLMCLPGVLLILPVLWVELMMMSGETTAGRMNLGSSMVFDLAAFGLLSLCVGTIRLGQGFLMMATKKRIDLTFKQPMTASERSLTYAYAAGWTSLVIGGAMLFALLA